VAAGPLQSSVNRVSMASADGPTNDGDSDVEHPSNWFLGACSAIMAIAALFVASHSGHGLGYYGGLAMFLFCIAFIMVLIRKTTAGEHHGGH